MGCVDQGRVDSTRDVRLSDFWTGDVWIGGHVDLGTCSSRKWNFES